MFYWIIFLISSILISYLVCSFFSQKAKLIAFIVTLTILVTPATIEQGGNTLAPSLFIFLFDLLLEQNFYTRSLRPFVISLPASFLLSFFVILFKRKFFQAQVPEAL